MKRFIAAFLFVSLLLVAASVSWGKGKSGGAGSQSATWETGGTKQ